MYCIKTHFLTFSEALTVGGGESSLQVTSDRQLFDGYSWCLFALMLQLLNLACVLNYVLHPFCI